MGEMQVVKSAPEPVERRCEFIPSLSFEVCCRSAKARHISHFTLKPFRLIAFFSFACSFLFVDSYAAGSGQSAEAQAHADAGLRFAQAGKLASAETELRQAVELTPTNAAFLVDLGTVLAMDKKLEESTGFFMEALKLNSRDVAARRYLAANLWQLRRFREAKQNLEILLKEKPGDEQGLLLLGMISENMKNYAAAARALAAVPHLVNGRPESIAALARSYYHLGESEKARALLAQLHGAAAVFLGSGIADEAGDYAVAEKMLDSIQNSFPDQAKLGYSLALAQYHAKRFEEAQSTLDHLRASGFESGEIYNLLGWCREQRQHHQDAVRAFQEAINLEPTNEANYLDLGTILLTERRLVPALELAKRMADVFPESPRTFLLKGRVELEAVHFTDAVDSFARAIQLDPLNPDATIGLARAQSGAGMMTPAKTTLENAIGHFPGKAGFELELAQLLLKESDAGDAGAGVKAERLLNLAVAHDKNLAEAHYLLGDLDLRRGQAQSALTHLERAAKLNPASAKIHFALSRGYRRLGQNEEAAKQAGLYDKLKERETSREPEPSPDGPSSN